MDSTNPKPGLADIVRTMSRDLKETGRGIKEKVIELGEDLTELPGEIKERAPGIAARARDEVCRGLGSVLAMYFYPTALRQARWVRKNSGLDSLKQSMPAEMFYTFGAVIGGMCSLGALTLTTIAGHPEVWAIPAITNAASGLYEWGRSAWERTHNEAYKLDRQQESKTLTKLS